MNICSQHLRLLDTKDGIIYANQQNNSPTLSFQIYFNKAMSLQYSKRKTEGYSPRSLYIDKWLLGRGYARWGHIIFN